MDKRKIRKVESKTRIQKTLEGTSGEGSIHL
jgi:hypothetical protein